MQTSPKTQPPFGSSVQGVRRPRRDDALLLQTAALLAPQCQPQSRRDRHSVCGVPLSPDPSDRTLRSRAHAGTPKRAPKRYPCSICGTPVQLQLNATGYDGAWVRCGNNLHLNMEKRLAHVVAHMNQQRNPCLSISLPDLLLSPAEVWHSIYLKESRTYDNTWSSERTLQRSGMYPLFTSQISALAARMVTAGCGGGTVQIVCCQRSA